MKPGLEEISVKREVVLITKYFLPSLNVDSDSVYQMIKGLKTLDPKLSIHVVTTASKYKGDFIDDGKYSVDLLKDIKIYRIKGLISDPKSSLMKILVDLIDGYRLVMGARDLKINNVISLSNPPLISLWHSLLLKGTNFFYWTFDIFPEALVAHGMLKSNNLFYILLKRITYANRPASIIALGEHQYEFLLDQYKKPINKIILPCGIHDEMRESELVKPFWKDSNVITIGYLGNLGRAHSLEFLKNVISCIANRPEFKLVLSIYGFHKDSLMNHINSIKCNNIQLVDFIEKSDLSLIDIHLVSLKESWNNISVPSKAVSAVCSGGALWFCGDEFVDTWNMFRHCSYKSSARVDAIESVLDTLDMKDLLKKKNMALTIRNDLLQKESLAYRSILNLLK
ncbi:hypothetical protein [Daejeonella sp.]|uniref:hypothetical protein n=1 Tax=Daejeonella sp. TaxID=2805397 RepID=UPI0030C15298